MSSGKNNDNGFSFEFGDANNHMGFSVIYMEELNKFYVSCQTFSSGRNPETNLMPNQTLSKIDFYADPNHSRIFQNKSFWDEVNSSMQKVFNKVEIKNIVNRESNK